MAATVRSLTGSRLKHYEVLEQLGAGGMGVVYRARDTRLQREVAIKVLFPSAFSAQVHERIREEALALSRLNHPNVEMVFDFDEQEDVHFLVLEMVHGISLDTRLGGAPLPEPEIVKIGVQLAEGLTAAHAQGVIHCDIKPANIRITPEGRVKILDFGLARAAAQGAADQNVTIDLAVSGTIPYMAPEQFDNAALDARTDIWAAGCVLYEMAIGRGPFHAPTTAQVIASIVQARVPQWNAETKVSPALQQVIMRCLEREPGSRYQSAKQLAEDLQRCASPSGTLYLSSQPKRARPWGWIAAAAAALAATTIAGVLLLQHRAGASASRIEAIAVLPLLNESHDPQQEYFTDGMTDELITMLSQLGDLRVISRTSAMRYRGTTKPLPEIARELNVQAVVEGSVLWSGKQVRISASLVDARADRSLWSAGYTRDLRDVLALQSEVAQAIARSIQLKLTPSTEERLASARAVSPEAYQLYLKARYYWAKRTEPDLNRAHDLFQQTIAIDPTYAEAYAGMAECYAVQTAYGLIPAEQGIALERDSAEKALSLNPSLAEAHAALASSFADAWQWDQSLAEYRRAIDINPNYATAEQWYAETLMTVGRADDALRSMKHALQSDPLSLIANAAAGYVQYEARRNNEAIATLRKTVDLDPSFHRGHFYLGLAYEANHQYAAAIAELEQCRHLPGGDSPETLAQLVHAYGRAGRKDDAARLLSELKRLAAARFVDPFYLAVAYDGAGDREAAIRSLEQAFSLHSKALTFQLQDPIFDDLHDDPRFRDLLHRMNLAP